MPDLTGLTALDVAIGLAFLFFLLSTIVASTHEMVSGWLGWRAQELEKALRSYLAAPQPDTGPRQPAPGATTVDELLAVPRLAMLVDDARNAPAGLTHWLTGGRRRSPSYIPARAFALTVLDTFAPPLPGKAGDPPPPVPPDPATGSGGVPQGKPGEAPSHDAIAAALALAEKIEIEPVRRVVIDALKEGRSNLEDIRKEVERSFDELMDRCAGWYKRRAQKFIVLFAVLATVGLNVDTFHIADRLWKEDALRNAVVQRAVAATDDAPAPAGEPEQTPEQRFAEQIDEVQELGVPLGWGTANVPAADLGSWLGRLAGWIATVLALSLGAPFWFDVLGKFAHLRQTGNREGTQKDDRRAPEDRDDPSRRRPAPR